MRLRSVLLINAVSRPGSKLHSRECSGVMYRDELQASLFENELTSGRPAFDLEVREGLLLITPKGEPSETVVTPVTNIAWGVREPSTPSPEVPGEPVPSITTKRATPTRRPER